MYVRHALLAGVHEKCKMHLNLHQFALPQEYENIAHFIVLCDYFYFR